MNPFTDLLDLDDKESYVAILAQQGLTQQEAEQVFQSLKAVYEKYKTAFDDLHRTRHGKQEQFEIEETESGPRISKSRVMVYDILDYYDQGATRGEIALSFNLRLGQVDLALNYIKEHRLALEAELPEIRARMAEEKAKYQNLQRQVEQKAAALSMTKEQKALYELKKENLQKREQAGDDSVE